MRVKWLLEVNWEIILGFVVTVEKQNKLFSFLLQNVSK